MSIGSGLRQPGYEQFVKNPQSSRGMHAHHHHHHHGERSEENPGRDEKIAAALAHLSQLKKTPSCFKCGIDQGLDFLKVCYPKSTKSNKLPEMPCLPQDELMEMIKCEDQDVESVLLLTSEDRKIHRKPCPKQEKAQMNVKALVQAHTRQTVAEYTPLEHPDPEDISPEVAATMMFTQEQGIKMDGCPQDTIRHLFPDKLKTLFPKKILGSSISVIGTSQTEQEQIFEKSASVPSEGVSDSAYTRTMKEKGEDFGAQKSYATNFAIDQSKREYILFAQKPQRFNKIQFRGGGLPSWFPGYFSAFPDEVGGMKVISSPSELFYKAWIHTNPKNIPTNDIIVLD